MKYRNMDDLRRYMNDVKYAEYTSFYGKRIREEQAERFYKAESRALRDHEDRIRREAAIRRSSPATVGYIKVAFYTSLILSSIFAVALSITGVTSILESLAVAAVGTGVLTFKSLT